MDTFADRLKELRLEKELSVRQLASALKISPSSISEWENNVGKPNLISIVKIAKFFNVTTDYLLGLEF